MTHDPFQYSGIEDVADILAITNPRASRQGYIDRIKAMALRDLSDDCSYCGALGFIITSYHFGGDINGPISYRVTLDAGCLKLGLRNFGHNLLEAEYDE